MYRFLERFDKMRKGININHIQNCLKIVSEQRPLSKIGTGIANPFAKRRNLAVGLSPPEAEPMQSTDFRSRKTQDFILQQLAQSMGMPRRQLEALDATTEDRDPVVEMSYHAYKAGKLDSAATLVCAR